MTESAATIEAAKTTTTSAITAIRVMESGNKQATEPSQKRVRIPTEKGSSGTAAGAGETTQDRRECKVK